ncbi:BREX-1 system phosphatase PglZ type A [Acidipropionibacterium jensenii]|uniref:BREX-1 system phosphatase PglZ type A n=1 Tax=Acidipropionibacterium jensenii TaxID=1749 RepID=UPI000BC2F774|nr:BREX-1 system phosphatase PglZ type A [Acidipropionibacterium jensenii]AZZ42537.1 BREX-1 system phosphatase PglZ type A [Acidipropionibacterium jensenii]
MSSLASVLPHLEEQFARHRLVFWHDPDGDYADELSSVDLHGVTVAAVSNDEYALKYQMLHERPDAKFLVYRQGAAPVGIRNWLLDLELSYGVFTADRTVLLRHDLGLACNGVDQVLDAHESFFRSSKRTEALKTLLNAADSTDLVQAKMCAVLMDQNEHSMLELTRSLLIENADGSSHEYESLDEFGLLDFHWAGVAKIYGYKADQPSVDDFVLWMFRNAIDGFKSDRPGALRNIELDFASLRNDRRSAKALMTLASRAAQDLDYARHLDDADLSTLAGNDLFEEVEQKVVSTLARQVTERTIGAREVIETIRGRQSSIWVDNYRDLYTAIGAASELLSTLATATFDLPSFDAGLQRYQQEWFRIDQLYRHFRLAVRSTDYGRVIETLGDEVENYYVNKFLFPLGAVWQHQVDAVSAWRSTALRPQSSFYRGQVEPLVRKGTKKAVVIVSDALRYEVAEELGTRIRQEDRFEATVEGMLGVLPSYTQLGMAALLPHKTLAHSAEGDPVLVDGQRSDGTVNRNKILESVDGFAIQAEEVMGMGNRELKQLYTEYHVFYVYHNGIDAAGDKAATERSVFEAAEATLGTLVRLVKKLASANATNIFVTADHGFLYQDSLLTDTGYLSTKPQGDDLTVVNRRYVLGRGLKDDAAFTTFEPEQVGLASDLQVQVPKSIHRLRLGGAGSRYVHGGAALQEIVVPVLAINKKRKSDTRQVNVDVQPETDKITTGQLVVKLYQTEPVNEKVQPHTLRAGLYVGETLISNETELVFDQVSDDARDRYQNVRVLLSQEADAFNNRVVEFRLEEQIPNTSQWRIYQRVPYTLRRSFTTDFDF